MSKLRACGKGNLKGYGSQYYLKVLSLVEEMRVVWRRDEGVQVDCVSEESHRLTCS